MKIKDGKVFACGTPWQGKEQYGCNKILPLEAICVLERDCENSIAPIRLDQTLETLLRQIYLPRKTDNMLKVLHICDKLGNSVKLYHLKCNTEPQAAVVSSSAMLAQE